MRLTSLLRGGLSFEKQWMKPKNVIIFSMSPFEQNAVKGQVLQRIPNLVRRIRDKIFLWAPPFVAGYWYYDWMLNENLRLKKKSPADFENDV